MPSCTHENRPDRRFCAKCGVPLGKVRSVIVKSAAGEGGETGVLCARAMGRRHAILDDNQRLLEERLATLRWTLPRLVGDRVVAATVIGSVADGRARDGSDIDLVLVLRQGEPVRRDYAWWDREVEPRLTNDRAGFPVQPLFVARSALRTNEPHLRRALATGIPLWDPEGMFHDQPESRA